MPVLSGAAPPPPDRALDALAAEYVLGTLSAHEAATVVRVMATDPALAAAVAAWEQRFAPLARLADEEAPPPDLWDRIERRITPQVAAGPALAGTGSVFARMPWMTRLLEGWAVGATAVAAALGAFIVLGGPEGRGEAPTMTVLLADRSQVAWTAAFERDGALRLAAIPAFNGATEVSTPVDRVLQLWALPPGATAPTSLSVLPRGERRITVRAPAVKPVPGMLIEITLEPTGGSPTGRPTGPVLFIGRLSQPGPNL